MATDCGDGSPPSPVLELLAKPVVPAKRELRIVFLCAGNLTVKRIALLSTPLKALAERGSLSLTIHKAVDNSFKLKDPSSDLYPTHVVVDWQLSLSSFVAALTSSPNTVKGIPADAASMMFFLSTRHVTIVTDAWAKRSSFGLPDVAPTSCSKKRGALQQERPTIPADLDFAWSVLEDAKNAEKKRASAKQPAAGPWLTAGSRASLDGPPVKKVKGSDLPGQYAALKPRDGAEPPSSPGRRHVSFKESEPAKAPPPPFCDCGNPTVARTTIKSDDPYWGRRFYMCAEDDCRFIPVWVDDWEAANEAASHAPAFHSTSTSTSSFSSSFSSATSIVSSSSKVTNPEKKGRGPHFPANQRVYDFFMNLSSHHNETKVFALDKHRTDNYKKTAERARDFHLELDCDKAANIDAFAKLPGVGPSTVQHLREFLVNGTVDRLKFFDNDTTRLGIKTLCTVHGIGPKTAYQFVHQGITTIEQLREKVKAGAVSLPPQTITGLKYCEEFQVPIPRSEVEHIGLEVKKVANSLYPGCEITITGSFRRGAAETHDCDVLITNWNYKDCLPVNGLMVVVKELHRQGFITDHLALPHDSEEKNKKNEQKKRKSTGANGEELNLDFREWFQNRTNQMYMGVVMIPESRIHRRIDIKWYEERQKPFASLLFTGNTFFNRSIKLYCKSRGLALSDHGLQPTERVTKANGKTEIISKGVSLPATSEEDIFKLLGLKYIPPTERDRYDAVVSWDSHNGNEEEVLDYAVSDDDEDATSSDEDMKVEIGTMGDGDADDDASEK